MPNVRKGAALRLTIWFSSLATCSVPVWGQLYGNPYDAALTEGSLNGGFGIVQETRINLPPPGRAAVVSKQTLQHPLSSKGRLLLEKAINLSRRGDHAAAIQGLRDALVKYPADAPYAHNLLGFEFLSTHQVMEAKNSYEEAVRLITDDSPNHSNYALSLAITGDLDGAEREARTAIALDSSNSKAKCILELLLMQKRAKSAAPKQP